MFNVSVGVGSVEVENQFSLNLNGGDHPNLWPLLLTYENISADTEKQSQATRADARLTPALVDSFPTLFIFH